MKCAGATELEDSGRGDGTRTQTQTLILSVFKQYLGLAHQGPVVGGLPTVGAVVGSWRTYLKFWFQLGFRPQ